MFERVHCAWNAAKGAGLSTLHAPSRKPAIKDEADKDPAGTRRDRGREGGADVAEVVQRGRGKASVEPTSAPSQNVRLEGRGGGGSEGQVADLLDLSRKGLAELVSQRTEVEDAVEVGFELYSPISEAVL